MLKDPQFASNSCNATPQDKHIITTSGIKCSCAGPDEICRFSEIVEFCGMDLNMTKCSKNTTLTAI